MNVKKVKFADFVLELLTDDVHFYSTELVNAAAGKARELGFIDDQWMLIEESRESKS